MRCKRQRDCRQCKEKKKKSEKRYKRRHKQGVKQTKVSQQHTHPAQMLVGVQNLELQLQEIPTMRALLTGIVQKSFIYVMTGGIDLLRSWWKTLAKVWNDSFVRSVSLPTFFPPKYHRFFTSYTVWRNFKWSCLKTWLKYNTRQ